MKFILNHRNHKPSEAFAALIQQRIESLERILRIDEARVTVERKPEASPPFSVSAHLVMPGPDLMANAADHTLRTALDKAIAQLEGSIAHRRAKRLRKKGFTRGKIARN